MKTNIFNQQKTFVASPKPTLWGSLVRLSLISLMLTVTSSCAKIDLEDFPDPIPTSGKVILTTDWSQRTEGIPIPANYTVNINKQKLTFTDVKNSLPELVTGTFPTLIHNTPERITIQGSTATIATTNGSIDCNPGWLFSQSLDVQYENGTEKSVTAIMQQQVRQLNLQLTIKEGDAAQIQSITASLSGVASKLDFKTNALTGSSTIIPTFSLNGDKLNTSVRLLGITSDTQKLTLNLAFSDGRTQSLDSDLGSKLSTFNTNKKEPLTLTADINTAIEVGGITATISNWKVIHENIIVN